MSVSAYARAVVVRWVWLLLAGTVGLLGAGILGALMPPSYVAQASLYVGAARVDGEDGAAWAARIRSEVVPSLTRLARSGVVLAGVADRLDLTGTYDDLRDRITVVMAEQTNVLDIAVTDTEPARAARIADAVAEEVTEQSAQLLTGSSGPLLEMRLVGPAVVPRFPEGPGPLPAAVAGAAAGIGIAVVGAGLAELARPRIRGRRDVEEVTSAPLLAALPVATHSQHPERLDSLAWQLGAVSARTQRGTVALVDASVGAGAGALAEQLAAQPSQRSAPQGPRTVALDDPRRIRTTQPDGVVVVADGRGTTRDQLAAAVARVHEGDVPLLGVVINNVLPARASGWARLRAGVRGDADEWLAERAPARPGTATGGNRVVAALAVAALGFSRELPMGLTTGLLASVALLPVWAPVVRRYRGATTLMALTALGLASGALLAWLSSQDHDFSRYEAASTAFLVLTFAGGTGVVLWARTALPLTVLGTAYGLGALASGILGVPGSENAWKFELSFPVTVIVLSQLAGWKRPILPVVLLLAVSSVSVANDARSAFAFTVVAAALLLWQRRGRRRPDRWGMQVAVLGILATGGYWLLRELLLAGVLGAGLQARTATQIAQTGSLLLGGRPEWTATWALMRDSPLGFGLGTVPSAHDVLVAAQGISVTRIPTVEGYLEHYLLAGRVELHSIVADLWSNLGPAGIALGLLVATLITVGLAVQVSRGQASALVCYLAPLTLWSLAFGPLPTGLSKVSLALALLMVPAVGRSRPLRVEGGSPSEEDLAEFGADTGARRAQVLA